VKHKTIWVINQFAGTPISGWGERHFYFAKYWQQNGYKVKIISGSYNHMFTNLPKVEGLYTHENYDGIDFYWVKTPSYNPKSMKRFYSMLLFAWRVLKLPIKVLEKPDIIIISSMPIFPIWSGLRIKKRFGSKVIFEIRDIWPLSLQLLGNYSANHPAVKFIGWFEKFGYRNSDAVVSLLPNAKAHVEEVAKQKVDFHYIPNGIDEHLLKYELVPSSHKQAIPKDKFVIGYAGTLGLANALEHFVGAAELLKEDKRFYFVIVGDGYLKESLSEKSKHWGNIIFLPKIKKNQVQDLIHYFDCCFVGRNDTPLFKHGVSANKYFDYMLSGKPILDSNNLIKDPVELSGCGIIVKPDSMESIVEGILQLFSMTENERHDMGNRGVKFVKENHNIKNLAEQYQQLF
jgi:glycosyltransferase involved in cell wall biosynthesis